MGTKEKSPIEDKTLFPYSFFIYLLVHIRLARWKRSRHRHLEWNYFKCVIPTFHLVLPLLNLRLPSPTSTGLDFMYPACPDSCVYPLRIV